MLFVRLAEGVVLDEDLEKRIRRKIRTGAWPRHVPARIVAVADIPRTKSGKIIELAVREVVHGRPVKNKEALANPRGAGSVPRPGRTGELSRLLEAMFGEENDKSHFYLLSNSFHSSYIYLYF